MKKRIPVSPKIDVESINNWHDVTPIEIDGCCNQLKRSSVEISDGPLKWVVDQKTAWEIAKRGFLQKKDADFSKVKRSMYGRYRNMLTPSFTYILVNGTKQEGHQLKEFMIVLIHWRVYS